MQNWKRPNWNELIPEAKSNFRCGNCNEIKTWQQQWSSTLENVCAICDDCKASEEIENKLKPEIEFTSEIIDEFKQFVLEAVHQDCHKDFDDHFAFLKVALQQFQDYKDDE